MRAKTRLRRAFGVVLLLAPGWCGFIGCGGPPAAELHVTILHTNDIHGHLRPFSYPDPPDTTSVIARMPVIKDIGGLARCATLVKRIRSEPGRHTLFLDAGDILDGTPFSVVYHGQADIAVMNAAGYDAMTLGNHEFNLTDAQFDSLLAAPRFPLLCANLRGLTDAAPRVRPHVILPAGELRVGVFGLTTPGSASYRACAGRYEVLSPAATAREMAASLRREGADIVVALTHMGFESELALADSVPEIDVIVGGHSHTRLAAPRVVRHGKDDFTLVVQAHQWAGELGRLDLTVSPRGDGRYEIADYEGRLIPVTSEIPEDSAAAAILRGYYDPMRPIYEEVLGKATADFANVGFERATVNVVADAMREASGATIALQNYGGVRDSFFRGPIRMWEVASMLPFENEIVVMQVSGARLRRGLEDERESLGPSGMRVVWDGGRAVSIEVGGAPLDSARVYDVATNGYIYEKIFPDVRVARTLDLMIRDVVVAHIRRAGTLSPVLDGRTRRAGA
jgi:5'-nucleotidase